MKNGYLLILLALGSYTLCDQRNMAWTYEYKTLEAGEAEIEYYFTTETSDSEFDGKSTSSSHQLELEVGMTNRFDIGIYQVFSQEVDEPLIYKGMKLRARYRFGEKGKFILDPLFYIEYKNNAEFSAPVLEFKTILAKDFGKTSLSINPILEFEKEDDSWTTESEYAMGISHRFSDIIGVGMEFIGSEHGHYAGPTISHGLQGLWMTLGTLYILNEKDVDLPDYKVRLLLGVNLR
ncbi:MAG: hypothetical protein H8D46_00460 [FCB group bacterium]|nr:hypothetical protein [FCB group bacterium]